MDEIIIYGCGKVGKFAYDYLKNDCNILFFVDKNKCGEKFKEINIFSPQKLLEYQNIKIIIASDLYYYEMLEEIKNLGITNPDIELFQIELTKTLPREIELKLDKKTIDLGEFLYNKKVELKCKELTFLGGSSGILDYVFLKEIAYISKTEEYLEVGTYIGESINILTDCCKKLYSVTAPIGSEYSMRPWCKNYKIADHSDKLAYNKKIVHYYEDSKKFDFSKHADTIDLYFIDGDHSYQGVYSDTKNIFKNKKEDSIVVWHDFKIPRNQYNAEVVTAVYDALQEDFDNVYVVDNNLCGIYIPNHRIKEFNFMLCERKYIENAPLYTYDVVLEKVKKII